MTQPSPPYLSVGAARGIELGHVDAPTEARSATRLLRGLAPDGRPLTLAGHDAVHGPLSLDGQTAAHLLGVVEESGLLGRGGGRFPLATKLRAVLDASGRAPAAPRPWKRPIVVVNAGSTEPAVRKDRVLVERTPHLVLDGLALAARIVGARDAVVWLHRGQATSVAAVQRALDERAAAARPGPRVRVVQGPPRYVAGEATATTRFLSGGPARPRGTPPHASARGVDGRPTLVANAETLAHLALVVRHGAPWFREVGPDEEPGTVLVTVAGAVAVPGVVEAVVGTTLAGLVTACGGLPGPDGRCDAPAAMLVGGYAGAWVPTALSAVTRFSRAGLAGVGAEPGAGLVHVLAPGACVATETANLVGWLARESAGQCGPCVNGLPALAAATRELAGSGPAAALAAERLDRWAAMVAGRGACRHPDGVVRLVRSLLRAMPDEVARHVAGAGCASRTAPGSVPLPVAPAAVGSGPWR